ncbi:AraC family transcriptional regulator [Paenibacillus sp. FSL H8-0548]|uniref:AraC family transcriptional regulator n=1 Tax=Paenibacillus sp. FSL H8-0548 TaxID=1920422 RepID=UPI00096FFD67|nr:AraC family transcriptional regulator [Paenibacillus sp. FSL H8-0548]OMF38858.1 AraC family transcriptional regulator [Paenibacillus sp. FSL H8-0548]
MDDKYAEDLKQNVKQAARSSIHHSQVTEHFKDEFPLFLNRWEEGFELRAHDHDYIEIVYVMAGDGYHYVGDIVERTYKGCLYVLPVGTSHVFRPSGASNKNKLIVYNLCIRPEFLDELTVWLLRYSDNQPFTIFKGSPGTYVAIVDKSMELVSLFEHMYREFSEMKSSFTTSIFGSLMQLSVRISRIWHQEVLSEDGDNVHLSSNLSNILDYVHLHFTERLTVEQLSAKFGISSRHFIRLFQSATGTGFSEFLQHKRVEYACRLLLETDFKIAYIAKSSGYKDTGHFNALFHKIVGTSPSLYRKTNKSLK